MGRTRFSLESDATKFWLMAAELAQPSSFWPKLTSMTDRMPLYPLLLAGLRATAGDAPRAVALIQAPIDAGTCALIAALGRATLSRDWIDCRHDGGALGNAHHLQQPDSD